MGFNVWISRCFPNMERNCFTLYITKTICHLFKKNYNIFIRENAYNFPKILDVLLLFYETRFMDLKISLICSRIIKIINEEQPYLLRNILTVLKEDVLSEILRIMS